MDAQDNTTLHATMPAVLQHPERGRAGQQTSLGAYLEKGWEQGKGGREGGKRADAATAPYL